MKKLTEKTEQNPNTKNNEEPIEIKWEKVKQNPTERLGQNLSKNYAKAHSQKK